MLKVGLTGGLASGKSTVAARLREHGLPVLDADLVVRELYAPGGAGAAAISSTYGPELLGEDGAVDRPKLAALVFGDPEAVAKLNALIHPLVHRAQADWFHELESNGKGIGVVEATLLIESGGRSRFDVLVTVSAPASVRLERAVARGGNRDDLAKRIAAQMPDEAREKVADIVLRSTGSKDDLLRDADDLADRLKRMAFHGA